MTNTHDVDHLFAPYVPDLLLTWPTTAGWQELEGTLVSADISGFTALSERLASRGREGAEELSALLCDCFDGMIDHAVGRGGDVIKFGGDALLVWFAGDGHAERAVSAGIGMRRTIRQERRTSDGRKVALSISIGAHSGAHHVFRTLGDVPDLMIAGPGASATVRAESDAASGMILVTPATAALLPHSWLGAPHASGIAVRRREPLPIHDVTAPRPAGTLPASAFVPSALHEHVVAQAVGEHRQAVVAFLAFSGADDLVGGGRIDLLARRLQDATEAVAQACDDNGVVTLATDVAVDGGKWILSAGAPRSAGNNEDRLFRTLRQVIDLDPGLQLHAGVNRGALFAGDLGSSRRRVYTVLGDVTNLAARLCGRAAPGQIVVSRSTYEWSNQEYDVEPLTPFHVKGKVQLVHAGLLGPFVGHRSDQLAADAPMIGRVGELALLLDRIDTAVTGPVAAAGITGPSGIGKSRLLAEVAACAVGSEPIILRCAPLDRLHGRSAIADVVRALLGLKLDTASEEVAARLRTVGEERLAHSAALLPLLSPVIGHEIAPTPESARVPVAMRDDRVAQLLVEVVGALVERHTLLLVDDAHHADDATAAVLRTLCEAGLELPLAIVLVTTPEACPAVERIDLDPLGDDELVPIVDGLVGDADISSETIRELIARSGGNPMFATELVRAVLDGVSGVPNSLDAAIEIRLDRLDPSDRAALRTAAVLGNEVDVQLLDRLLGRGVLADHDRWDRLQEFLERVGPGTVRFRFDAHRRVAYEALPFRRRRAMHAEVLATLESEAPERMDSELERLVVMARHAAGAADDVRTWRYAVAAGEAMANAGRFAEAARLYRMAWASRRAADPDALGGFAERAGDVFEVAGDFDAAEAAFIRSLGLAAEVVDRARLWRKRGDVAERRGDYVVARQHYRRADRELRRAGWAQSVREQAQLDCALSGLALRQSQFGDAWRYGNRALSQAERVGDWPTAAHAALMVDNLITQMEWAGVEVSRPDVLLLHQRADDPLGAARWLSNQAVDRYYEGAWDDAIRMYRDSAEQCAQFGHLVSEATALNNIAEIESDRGRYDEARTLLRAARRSWRAIGYGVGVALAQANLGRLATRLRDFEDADPLLDDAIERFDVLDMASMAADARLRKIENALLGGSAAIAAHWWPADAALDEDVVARIYDERLRAVQALVHGKTVPALEWVGRSVDRSREAGVPFDLSLALRVRLAITGDRQDAEEIDAIQRRLGIVTPPPVVPRRVTS